MNGRSAGVRVQGLNRPQKEPRRKHAEHVVLCSGVSHIYNVDAGS